MQMPSVLSYKEKDIKSDYIFVNSNLPLLQILTDSISLFQALEDLVCPVYPIRSNLIQDSRKISEKVHDLMAVNNN